MLIILLTFKFIGDLEKKAVGRRFPLFGLFYPVSEFEDGVFQENFPRSIVLDIYEHLPNKNMSYARARFLIRKNDKIPLGTKFKIFDGARCIADVMSTF